MGEKNREETYYKTYRHHVDGIKTSNLLCRRNLTPVRNVCEAAPSSIFLNPVRITGTAFRISLHPDWLFPVDGPIIERTQILAHIDRHIGRGVHKINMIRFF